jgi:transcriptional regulator with PAS, ATPase and Fis domain
MKKEHTCFDLQKTLDTFEKAAIEAALACANGIVSVAAQVLNMGRTTLVEKCKLP